MDKFHCTGNLIKILNLVILKFKDLIILANINVSSYLCVLYIFFPFLRQEYGQKKLIVDTDTVPHSVLYNKPEN